MPSVDVESAYVRRSTTKITLAVVRFAALKQHFLLYLKVSKRWVGDCWHVCN